MTVRGDKVGGTENQQALREREIARYDQAYFSTHYWAEDIGKKGGGNRGLSYSDPLHIQRFAFLADRLVSGFEFKTCLDAGCGMGGMMNELIGRGKVAAGCDASPTAILSCQERGLRVKQARLDNLPYPSNSFDLVFCSDVLEHLLVFDIHNAATELVRVARQFLVLTINLDNPYEFHPTILSRSTWMSLFLSIPNVAHLSQVERDIQENSDDRHPEYEWFCFSLGGVH